MTAVLPSGSPGLDDDELQSWENLSTHAGSFAGSGYGEYGLSVPSPSMHSQGSYVHVNNNNNVAAAGQPMRPLSTPSPIMSAHPHALSASPFSAAPFSADAAGFGAMPASKFDNDSNSAMFNFFTAEAQQQHAPQQQFSVQTLLQEALAAPQSFEFAHTPTDDFLSCFNADFNAVPTLPDSSYTTTMDPHAQLTQQLGIPTSMRDPANAVPWAPTGLQTDVFASEHYTTPPPRSTGSLSISPSPRIPTSPAVKQEPRGGAPSSKKPGPQSTHTSKKPAGISKMHKKKSPTSSRSSSGSDSPDHSNNRFSDGALMFCNQTVDTWGKGPAGGSGDLESIERSSQKGRKGALSEETRANALVVRQQGACFCCKWRKVKCNGQRPCLQCKKLCQQVPEAVCWKFQDFNSALFPEFIRGHFRRHETARFVNANVASFTLGGVEVPARVTLSSGPTFGTKLVVNAKFFTAKDVSSDVMQQWYQFIGANGVVELEALRAAPIGLDISTDATASSQRNELRRKVEAYVDALVAEPSYALQLTDSIRKTDVPRRVLHAVQQYAQASGASIVRDALAIYAMHYVLTRHLTMTPQTIAALQAVNPVAAAGPFLTPRLLNRQIKAVIDDVLQQKVGALFDGFTKRLKLKAKEQWAPCMAAFLVFTLLMEAIETAADVYAITDNEIEMRNLQPARFRRAEALEINGRIENMPFKQFAFQFHRVYQTHTRDASEKALNPFAGEGLSDLTELGPGAEDLVLGLRSLLQFECE